MGSARRDQPANAAAAAPGGPLQRYQALCEQGSLLLDPDQFDLAHRLDQRYRSLSKRRKRFRRKTPSPPGLYIHGQVGRGKTLLMDLFAQSLNEAGMAVERSHFHRFMDGVHRQLNALGQRRNPLQAIAEALASRTRVLCFDEFHVDDIADAMLLGELTRQWFELDLCLITTSNAAPGELYKDGLQRQRFVPAIANIEQHCEVIELGAAQDFRLRQLKRRLTWHEPLAADAHARMHQAFTDLCPFGQSSHEAIEVNGRNMTVHARSMSVLWVGFTVLCDQPRSAADYVALARRFSTLLLDAIPIMNDDDNNAAKRFIHLIDECYDRSVKLVASADAPIESIYQGLRLAQPFQRTVSRLIEMQSEAYLSRPHRP
ncbi:MAG: cell division protein ZapE [Pseudomonadota bacterium]